MKANVSFQVAIIGMLLGPMFPIVVAHCSRIFPHWLLTAIIGWVTGIGMSGSAMLPFITGILSSKYGIKSLQPL
jgi:fucose permease